MDHVLYGVGNAVPSVPSDEFVLDGQIHPYANRTAALRRTERRGRRSLQVQFAGETKKRSFVPVIGDERPDKSLPRYHPHSPFGALIRRSHALDPVTAVTPASPTVISDRSSRGKALFSMLSGSHRPTLSENMCRKHDDPINAFDIYVAYSSTNKWKVQDLFH